MSVYTGSSSVNGVLRLNGEYLINYNSGNVLMKSRVSSSGTGESIMVEIYSLDSGNDESVTINLDV